MCLIPQRIYCYAVGFFKAPGWSLALKSCLVSYFFVLQLKKKIKGGAFKINPNTRE